MTYFNITDRELTCSKCDTTFSCSRKRFYDHTRKLKANGHHSILCDNCNPRKTNPTKSHICLNCNNPTNNSKFCSRSCAQSYNNKIRPKRKPIERICSCGKTFIPKFKSSRRLCESCQEKRQVSVEFKAKTLSSYHEKKSVKDKHPSWKNSHIRILNRSWNKEMLKRPCEHCGYDKHVELCHIKPVSSFPETATLAEVNAPENNKVLCRNCHWEFDHNL